MALAIDGVPVAASATELDQRALNATLPDVSTAGQAYVVSPWAGKVTAVYSVLNGAIATGDATLTVKDDAGSSMGTITIANAASAAGDLDSLTPTTNNTVSAGDRIEVETDGGSTNAVAVDLTIVVQIT